LTNPEHVELLNTISHLTGMVVLSGYASALYDRTLLGWRQIRKQVVCSSSPAWKENGGTKPVRTEVIWINPAVQAALPLNRRMAA
jgi:DNA adenine methylase